ncbi:AfsR/SARP family transcriptional regulator [Halomonas sp. M20]|uniref:AfsR/SARP family transcriptional regulator n=1 Tax=Halomonas sp. M20 TaxID=2763264 RepID=UPI001D0A1806|nr:BTAD domain-containing putative transcriptional regulator [Halomonas sp. M20]
MINIYLLGRPRLEMEHNRASQFTSRRSRALFCLLALHAGKWLSRSQIVDLLWPKRDDIRTSNCLSTELWRLKSALRQQGMPVDQLIRTQDSGIGLCIDCQFWSDVGELERLHRSLPHSQSEKLDYGALLEAGLDELRYSDFAEGMNEDWCWLERERFRAKFLDLLATLLHLAEERRAWHDVLDYGHRLLAYDPLQERIHRAMMRAHIALGNRAAAMRQFRILANRLQSDLHGVPTQETLCLVRALHTTPPIESTSQESRAPLPRSSYALEDQPPGQLLQSAMHHLIIAENLLIEALKNSEE